MNEYNVINTSQKKSDWNANEGEAGYIKNRTHYETVEETEVTHTFTIPDDYDEDYYAETNPEDDAIIQALYNTYVSGNQETGFPPKLVSSGKIKINGVEHDCYWYIVIESAHYEIFCYDREIIDFNENEVDPYFEIWDDYSEPEITYYLSYFNIGQNEICCPIIKTTIKKIDEKFLPDIGGGGLNNAKDAENGGIVEGVINGEEGQVNIASGLNAHAEGGKTWTESGQAFYSITTASGEASHAEGMGTTASGEVSHAEGFEAIASGEHSHAEGDGTTASGAYSHAEGYHLTASGMYSHAEGVNTTASGNSSHAEGGGTTASGAASHAEGSNTIANHRNQHVFGEYNIADPSANAATEHGNYVEIVGNGTWNAKSNARTLDWSGNEVLSGKLTVGTQPTNDNDVATKKYVDDHSGGGALICTLNPNVSPRVLDHTFGEIYNALRSGRPVFMDDVMYGTIRSIAQFIYASEQPNLYSIRFSDQAWNFLSGSIDDYPTEDLD